MNPKDLVGSKKAPLGLVPPALEIGASEALEDGARKYGPFNWREIPVEYMTYLVAMKRHIDALIDGEDLASDSGIHHLRHIVAGGGILLDSLALGVLIDNRPPKGPAADMLKGLDRSKTPPEPKPDWQEAEQARAAAGLPATIAARRHQSKTVNPTKFLCGHAFGEEPITDKTKGPLCGTAIHWSRVNGVERTPAWDSIPPWSPNAEWDCKMTANHETGHHLLTCPDYN